MIVPLSRGPSTSWVFAVWLLVVPHSWSPTVMSASAPVERLAGHGSARVRLVPDADAGELVDTWIGSAASDREAGPGRQPSGGPDVEPSTRALDSGAGGADSVAPDTVV